MRLRAGDTAVTTDDAVGIRTDETHISTFWSAVPASVLPVTRDASLLAGDVTLVVSVTSDDGDDESISISSQCCAAVDNLEKCWSRDGRGVMCLLIHARGSGVVSVASSTGP